MKKILLLILLIGLTGSAWANMTREQSRRVDRAMASATKGQEIFVLAKEGRLAELRKEILHVDRDALLVQDGYQNNILHIAKNAETFGFLWNVLGDEMRETLLAQKNKSGETPLMSHIMYGHENIFRQYFPRTRLYRKLRDAANGLQNKGLNGGIASIKRAGLLEQCTVGNQNMWQRADGLYRASYGSEYASSYREQMKAVRDMIGEAAPFMVRS